MPSYQYTCRECEQGFEKKLPMAQASDVQACPECGSFDTRKVIGSIAVSSGSSAPVRSMAPPAASPFS